MNVTQHTQPRMGQLPDRWSLAPHLPVQRHGGRLLVAIATADGAHVDRAFEHAESFLLYERDGERTCYVGCQPCPRAAADAAGHRTRLLADCDLVLCAGISDICRQALAGLGIGCNIGFAGATVSAAVTELGKQNGH